MTYEGATIYYSAEQNSDFKKACMNLHELGLNIRNSNAQIITGVLADDGGFEDASFEKAQDMFASKGFGFYLWLTNGHLIFWSSVKKENYFFHNFRFNSLDGDEIEQTVSQIFIKLAWQELNNSNDNFLGFTLDQFGHNEDYDFSKIYQPQNNEILSHHYISDITFLSNKKIQRFALENESEIIKINQDFNCIAKNPELANYLRSLL